MKEPAGYLAAMIDGEGCIRMQITNGCIKSRAIQIHNTDPSIIDACLEACDQLGITYKVYGVDRTKQHYKDIEIVAIMGKDNFEKVLELVPIRCKAKLAKLKKIVVSYQQYQRNRNDIPVDEIKELYVTQRKTGPEIAARLGVATSTFYRWLELSNIPRRTRWT